MYVIGFLLGEGDALYKIQVGFTIIVFPILVNFFFNKISYSKYCKDLKRNLGKLFESEPISSDYKWEWYIDTNDVSPL